MVRRVLKRVKSVMRDIEKIKMLNYEIQYSHIWHDTIKGISWISNLGALSPGRWAVGYNYLYVMTRILEELRPDRILELGLGVSTSLISAYFSEHSGEEAEHIIIEHDEKWVEFYTSSHAIMPYSKVFLCDLKINKDERGICPYYDNFVETIGEKKFQVISIDGPFGGDFFSRRDILDCLPEILLDDFVIVLDDTERPGEQRTVADIIKKLEKGEIKFAIGTYCGEKSVTVIASESCKFLCSM